jgi:hypothetical protein
MTTVTIRLGTETEQNLREKARLLGQTLEAYLQHVAEREAKGPNGAAARTPSDQWSAEWRNWAASHSKLPGAADDSRESIYADRGE